jgi:parallel beta helix pectate lyase-like protein
MNNAIKSLAFLAAAASVCTAASAATYYVSDCQTGAAAGCTAGSDSNDGLSEAKAWRTTAPINSKFSGMAAGDKILFAKGGSWVNAAMNSLQNLKTSTTNRITFDSYQPSWNKTTANKPILADTRSGNSIFGFDNGSTPVVDRGYNVRNLELRGGGSGGNGIFVGALSGGILLDNLTIDGFAIGVYCGNDTDGITFTNSLLTNNRNQGILWSCNNSLIENNIFRRNGYDRPVYDHSAYISGEAAKNITMRGNKLYDNSENASGVCESTGIVVHGVQNGLTIENNLLYQEPGKATVGCWAVIVDPGYLGSEVETFDGVVIRGNTIVNYGGVGIGCAGCRAPLIEKNTIVVESSPDVIGIRIPDRQRPGNTSVDSGAIIRNNSIYFKTTPAYAQGIAVAPNGSSTIGTNVQIHSNLIYFGPGSSNHQCFDITSVSRSNFATFDNNLCFHAGNNGTYSYQHQTLSAAKSAGFDTNGLSSDPKIVAPVLANGFTMSLQSGSPAIKTGLDIGSFDLDLGVSTDKVAPAAPSSLIVN